MLSLKLLVEKFSGLRACDKKKKTVDVSEDRTPNMAATGEDHATASANLVEEGLANGTNNSAANNGDIAVAVLNDNVDPTQAILAYLGGSFSNPEQLLRGLAGANGLLSGSRAVEAFVPGTCTAQSDWDFYVHPSAACVGRLMDVLSDQGVEWDGPYERFVRLQQASSPTVLTMTRAEIKELRARYQANGFTPPESVREALERVDAELYNNRRKTFVRIGEHGGINIIPNRRASKNSQYTTLQIVTGHTTHNDSDQQVQLIFAKDVKPLQHVMNFYASNVQCIFAGYGAVHFYHADAAAHVATKWANNSQAPNKVAAAVQKYEERGWEFRDQTPAQTSSRVLKQVGVGAHGSKLFEFDLDLHLPDGLEAGRRLAFGRLAWQELEGRTTLIPSPPPARVRLHKVASEVTAFEQDVGTARRHSIAFSHLPGGDHAYAQDVFLC